MKHLHLVLWLVFASVSLPLTAETLTISRISVTGTETTDPAVVKAAFVEVAVGDSLPEERLVEALDLIRNRLLSWGYFGSVDLTLVRSKARPGTAAVVAEVTEGFTGRYGGGPIYARVGQANWGGQGLDAEGALGWNRQSASVQALLPSSRGVSWNFEGGNRPEVWVSPEGKSIEDHRLGASLGTTVDWGWGWHSSGRAGTDWRTGPRYQSGQWQASPAVSLGWTRTDLGFSPSRGASLDAGASVTWPSEQVRSNLDVRTYLPLGGGFKLATRAAGVVLSKEPTTREAVLLSGLDGVRKPFEPTDLGQAAGWASAELRWAAVDWNLAGFTTLSLEPALVADAGLSWATGRRSTAWVAGGAVRLFVAAPVGVPIRLEATWDDQGRARWGFGVAAPF